jgi:cell division protein FtsQ
MMPLQKNKRILFYIFLFLIIGTLNNKILSNFEFPKINKIYVTGLSEEENLEILKSLEKYKFYNLFILDKFKIKESINEYNFIEKFSITKEYPSSLNVKLNRTKFLAYVNKDNKTFYLGSNGKFIKANEISRKLPYIFGDLNVQKFFDFFNIINNSNFKFIDIKNLFFFPSGRWDIETYSGVLIKLPKQKLKESIDLSIEILKNENFKNVQTIDLRQHMQIIVNE